MTPYDIENLYNLIRTGTFFSKNSKWQKAYSPVINDIVLYAVYV